MGLAASQARLLTITARKADCEFQSMALSHQKIALARDMESISNEYQDAMNKTKLVYDFYGSGTSEMNLNYALLMKPSVYNDYYPKLITDNKNRLVLSGKYAAAARAAGVPTEGYNGTPSSAVRNAFVEALRDGGVISAAQATTIESISYNNAVGLGATFSATEATQDITYADLKNLIKASCQDTSDYGITIGPELGNPNAMGVDVTLSFRDGRGTGIRLFKKDGGGSFSQVANESTANYNLSLYDLLKFSDSDTHYVLSFDTGRGPCTPLSEAAVAQQYLVGSEQSASFLNWMVDQFSSILGGVSKNDLALQYAYDQVYDLIYPNEDIQKLATEWKNRGWPHDDRYDQSEETEHNQDNNNELLNIISTSTANCWDEDETETVANDALSYVGFTRSGCWSDANGTFGGWSNSVPSIAMDLNTLTQVFMTAFMEYLTDSKAYTYNVGKKDEQSLWDEDNDFILQIKAPSDVDSGEDNLIAGFYDSLFNRICANGWTENDNIENAEYMQELLKSGSVYISSIDSDGSYYQSSYSTDSYIAEVADTDGVAQAEAKYNAAKAKIENKENTIDMKMKNLDTEISSLTTEYDTMKNVISKSIEKSFKRYDA